MRKSSIQLFVKALLASAALAGLAASASAGTTYYKYDALGRVLLTSAPDGTQEGFSYDAAGNRTAVRRNLMTPPSAANQLTAGQALIVGASLHSASGRYTLIMQEDGNLALYGQSGNLWHAATNGNPSAHAVFQGDGNFVVYGPVGQVYWNSGTGGHPGSVLVLQDDGNLVIYQGGTAVWNTGTGCGLC